MSATTVAQHGHAHLLLFTRATTPTSFPSIMGSPGIQRDYSTSRIMLGPVGAISHPTLTSVIASARWILFQQLPDGCWIRIQMGTQISIAQTMAVTHGLCSLASHPQRKFCRT